MALQTTVFMKAGITYWKSSGITYWKSTGLMIELLRVRIKAGAAGEFSSSVLTLRANSYSDRSGTYKTPVFLPKVQVAGYT